MERRSASRPWLGRIFDIASFTAQQVIQNWSAIAVYLGGGAAMSYLAHLQQLPPLAWGFAFFAGLIGVAVFRFFSAKSYLARASGDYVRVASQPTKTINPLQPNFTGEKISLTDFWHGLADLRTYRTRVFRDCHLHGPAAIALAGASRVEGSNFTNCDIICLTKDTMIQTAIMFYGSTFYDCYFVNATIYVSKAHCDLMIADALKQGKPRPEIIGYPNEPSRSP